MQSDTINAKDAAEIFRRPRSTIYSWSKTQGIATFDERFGELRFDLVALRCLSSGDRHSLRLYRAGLLDPIRIDEIKSSIGLGGSKTELLPDAFVPLAIEPSTRVEATLRSQLFADAAAQGRSPLDVLVACYAANMTARGIAPEAGK